MVKIASAMLNAIILQLETVIREYGAVGVLIASFFQEIIAPLPSSLVAMFAGFFLIPVELTWTNAVIVVLLKISILISIGITAGSLFIYAIAYFGGKPIITRYGKWFGINWTSIEQIERKFTKGYADELTLFSVRALPIIPNVVMSIFCGLIRYPVKTYLLITLAGAFIRAMIMVIIGRQARDAYIIYAEIISQIEIFIFAFIGITLIIFLFLQWRKKMKKRKL